MLSTSKSTHATWIYERRPLRLKSHVNTAAFVICIAPLCVYIITFILVLNKLIPPISFLQTESEDVASTAVLRSAILLPSPPSVSSHTHHYRLSDVTVPSTSTSESVYALHYTIEAASATFDCHEFDRGRPYFVGFDEDPNGSNACRNTYQHRSGDWKCMAPTDSSFPWRPSYRLAQPFIFTAREPVLTDWTGRFTTLDQAHRWHIAPPCWYTKQGWNKVNGVNLTTIPHYKRAIILSQTVSNNYFHFVVESLPRFNLLPQHIREDNNIPILVIEPVYNNMKDFFQCLGMSHRIRWLNETDVILIDEMIQPMAGQCKEPNPIMLLNLRQQFFSDSCLSSTILAPVTKHVHHDGIIRNIVWMVRSGRRLTNNDELLTRLHQLFPAANIIIHNSSYSLNDTARIFYQADMIIGPHGAGFVNIIFARVGTIIIEMIAQGYPNYIGFHFAAIYGLQYYILVSRGGTWMTDINIRINEFEQLINLIQTEKEMNTRVTLKNLTQWNISCDITKDLRKL